MSYDMLGHATALAARLTGATGAQLWKTSAGYLWPSLANSVAEDAYWTSFFAVALTLIILGR